MSLLKIEFLVFYQNSQSRGKCLALHLRHWLACLDPILEYPGSYPSSGSQFQPSDDADSER